MLGRGTLSYDDPVQQGLAALEVRELMQGIFGGHDPFQVAFAAAQTPYESRHLTKQQRKLRTPEEVMSLPGDRVLVFADGLPAPLCAQRAPYWTVDWVAGRYHPDPYHPPLDRVSVQTSWGPRMRPVIVEPVPEEFAAYPQYRSGLWSYIGRFPNPGAESLASAGGCPRMISPKMRIRHLRSIKRAFAPQPERRLGDGAP